MSDFENPQSQITILGRFGVENHTLDDLRSLLVRFARAVDPKGTRLQRVVGGEDVEPDGGAGGGGGGGGEDDEWDGDWDGDSYGDGVDHYADGGAG